MKKNMGKTDRILRSIAGTVILAVGIYYQNWWGTVGLILLLTSLISWCPIYVPLKLSTKKD